VIEEEEEHEKTANGALLEKVSISLELPQTTTVLKKTMSWKIRRYQ